MNVKALVFSTGDIDTVFKQMLVQGCALNSESTSMPIIISMLIPTLLAMQMLVPMPVFALLPTSSMSLQKTR